MNSTNLVGRLTATPALRYTPSGAPVTDLRLAVDRRGDGTDFLTVTAWNRTAEVVTEHLTSGRRIAVSGRLEQQTWTDHDSGANREKVVVVADRIDFLDAPRRDDNDRSGASGADNGNAADSGATRDTSESPATPT